MLGSIIVRGLLICALVPLATTSAAVPGTFHSESRTSERASSQLVSCAPRVRRPNRAIAPGVLLVRSSTGPGNCGTMIHVATRGPTGVLWGLDTSSALWRSTNNMTTWTRVWKPGGYRAVEHVLQLRSGRVLLVVYKNNGRRFILRSTDRSGTRFPRKPVFAFPFDSSIDPALATATSPRILSPDSWVEAGRTIYVGEYGSNPNPVYLWKSETGGRSFKVAATFRGVRHIHSVLRDPYGSHAIWLTIGDNGPQPRIGYSIDKGATFTFVSSGKYPESRAVGLMFTRQAVYWATDTPDVPAGLFRWDRQTHAVSRVLSALNGPFYFGFQYKNVYVTFSHVGTKQSDAYIGDQVIHAITSTNGFAWKSTITPWRRDQSPDSLRIGRKAAIVSFTKPDRHGRFWVYFYDLVSATNHVSNFELQLR